MRIRPTKGLTFDDVLLVPQRSPIASRKDVDTSTLLTASIRLRVPVISANMDTVTEAAMAIAMAARGGLGIIHRFMTVDQQVRQIKQVKRSQGFVVDNPYTIAPERRFPMRRVRCNCTRSAVWSSRVKMAGWWVGHPP